MLEEIDQQMVTTRPKTAFEMNMEILQGTPKPEPVVITERQGQQLIGMSGNLGQVSKRLSDICETSSGLVKKRVS